MFSVIIPTLNEQKFLPKLLTSLSEQTYKDFEVIIVDGSSEDKTVSRARSFQKKLPRLTIIEHVKRGVSFQRNQGASLAHGDWFVFIDADSVLLPYAFDRFRSFIASYHPKHFTSWIKPDSEKSDEVIVTVLGNFLIEGGQLLRRPFAVGALTVVEKSVFYAIHGFDETMKFGEDYDLTHRICKQGTPFHIIRETLYVYSMRRYRLQGTFKLFQTMAKSIISVLITKKTPRNMPGYIMGGQPYNTKRKPIHPSVIKRFNAKVKELVQELFI
jgi:glycosyltransferase involved in cell wall biosynthesis